MHRLAKKFRAFFMRQVKPSLCHDCDVKLSRKFGLSHKIKHRMKHRRKGHKLHGAAKAAFLRRMAAGRRKARR